MRFEVV